MYLKLLFERVRISKIEFTAMTEVYNKIDNSELSGEELNDALELSDNQEVRYRPRRYVGRSTDSIMAIIPGRYLSLV